MHSNMASITFFLIHRSARQEYEYQLTVTVLHSDLLCKSASEGGSASEFLGTFWHCCLATINVEASPAIATRTMMNRNEFGIVTNLEAQITV